MIYVTHDQVEAMTLATRMAVMHGGVIQQFGTPAEVYARPANLFVATFLGTPAMNLVNGTLEPRDGSLHFCTEHWRLDMSNYVFAKPLGASQPQSCVLGVRAGDVRLGEGRGGPAERAKVSLLEPMGNHRVVWLDYHGVQIASIDQSKTPVAPGDTLAFSLDGTHVSLFDAANGTRL